MSFIEPYWYDTLKVFRDFTINSSTNWNMKTFMKQEQCHDQNTNGNSTYNDNNDIQALEFQDKERIRKNIERADKKRNQFKKSQQHLKSKQKYKSYNRTREELVDTTDISEGITSDVPNVSENKHSSSNISTIPATKCTKIPEEIYNIPSITSKSLPATGCQKRKNPFESKQSFRIRKAKPKFLKLYTCLRERYNIRLVCKSCLVDVRGASSQWKYELLKDPHHKCSFDHLAVSEKNAKTESWSLVRDVRGRKTKVICHQFMIGEKCRLGYQCPYPHTTDELEIWFKYLNGQVLPAFIEDVSKSDLRLRIELLDFHKKSLGLFIFYCFTCSKKDPPTYEIKKKHVSFCRAGHKWTKKLFHKKGSTISEIHSVKYQCNHEHCKSFHKLLKLGFKEEEIVLTSESINQSMHSRKKQQIKFDAFDYETMPDEIDYCEPPVPLEEALDDEKSSKWISFPYQDLDEYYKQSMEEEYDKNVNMSAEMYYKMFCTQRLKELLKSDGAVFRRCRLNLKGTNRAVCDFIDIDKESKLVSVELRSRKNCGPCFNGDEVVVELKDTKELGDDEAIVKRGTVVGVLNHAFNRREYTYLCKVDPYINHLMIPINGIGPKLHVIREKTRFDHKNMIFVYENVEEDVLHLKKSCYLSQEEKETTLFVVKYVKWNFTHMYPLGYVCGMLRAGSTVEETQAILDVIYQIPNNYDLESIGDDSENVEAASVASEEDLTDLLTISIDPENSKDIDDAISIEKCPEGHCNLIVHIANVSHYVSMGDKYDQEASKRMISYYPLTGVRSMLPKKLSDDWCSLLEGKKRRALSIYFQCDKSGRINLDEQPIIKETLIKNKKQFSYKQVQRILDENRIDGDLNKFLQFLFSTSQNLRKDRLKMGWMYREETESPFVTEQCFEAHQLIEEFMILTNFVVAKFLVKKFPLVVPLRCQEEPNEERKNAWIEDWSYILEGSVYFDRFFGEKLHKNNEFVTFLKATVVKMDECMKGKDGHKNIIKLIGNEKNHPLHAIALIQWFSIQENAFYVCSGDMDIKEKYHYSLNPSGNKSEYYVQFTSPIRRYLDLVVHRLVKAALNNESSPYSCLDVMKLCNKANIILHESKKYKREVDLTKLSIFLERPLFVPIFISELNENLMEFVSPFLPKITSRYKQIKHNQLLLSDKPDKQKIPETTKEDLHLMWDKRIFDAQEDVFHKPYARQTMDEVSLNPKRHVHEVQASLWRTFLSTLCEGNRDKIQLKWQEVKEKMDLRNKYQMGLPEVTSEMKNNDIMTRPQVKFSLNLKKGSVVAVQLGKSITDGYLRPQIKMISITDQLDICLCHKRSPIECFVTSSKACTLERYPNVNEYIRIWLPILSMEAATTAVDSRDSIFCHNVPICLQKENDSYYGWLKLEKSFCKKRKINIDVSDDDGCKIGDFLCIRFPLKQDNVGGNIYHSFIPNKWVCHAVAIHDSIGETFKNNNAKETITLSFKVQQFDCMPPDEVIMSDLVHHCTVEFLSKPLPEKKMGEVLTCLNNSSDLCKVVALGHSMEHLENFLDLHELDGTSTFDIEVGKNEWFCKNNHNQSKAIFMALTRPFTLIQGPPGTGKTVTAIKIAWWFVKANKRKKQGHQVLYCGPSNSSVDVAAEWLKRLGPQCPKIVRVYGKQLERQWYPMPRYSGVLLSRSQCNDLLSNIRDENTIDLHHLIRRPDKPYAQEINEYDKCFRDHLDVPEKISDKKVAEYERLLDVASKEELKSYDIILCTCIASSSSRIKGSKFCQLIIDECGMCKEPESLIPLVKHKEIKQVVLIGDHKQLQPIVKNRIASDLGLKTSLFERYHDDALMLNYQYRMHEKLCEFPSKQFYNGHLKTFANKRHHMLTNFWPTCVPLLFCHVEGAEKSMIVSTSEGNEESKSNKVEAIEVIRIYRELRFISRWPKICILSQYGAQCNLIKQEFAETGEVNVPVTTVVSSQGNEFDYVILSLVRSMPEYEIEKNPSPGWCLKNLGFITDEHQINVALTRARHGLIILGNKYLLRCNDLFDKLLKDYEKMGCVINSEDFKPSQNRFDQPYLGKKFGKKRSKQNQYAYL